MAGRRPLLGFPMPNSRLFIVGAPKCGTTSLANWLSEHPDIYMSETKEPHYYSHDLRNRTIDTKSEYEKLFVSAPENVKFLTEASTWYLYSDVAVENIIEDHPDARLIVMSRDPVQMAISLFYHNRFKSYEDQVSMKQAWALQQKRAQGEGIPLACIEPAFLQYGKACALGSLIQRLLERVDGQRVLHVRLESLKNNAPGEYQRILNFLELPYEGRTNFSAHNEAKVSRVRFVNSALRMASGIKRKLGINRSFGVRRLNEAKLSEKKVDAELIRDLEEFFRAEKALVDSL